MWTFLFMKFVSDNAINFSIAFLYKLSATISFQQNKISLYVQDIFFSCIRYTIGITLLYLSYLEIISSSHTSLLTFSLIRNDQWRDRSVKVWKFELPKLETRNSQSDTACRKFCFCTWNHVDNKSKQRIYNDVLHTCGSQWRSMARASSIRSTGSSISSAGVAGGTYGPDLNWLSEHWISLTGFHTKS